MRLMPLEHTPVSSPIPTRRESAALRMLASGELGAHLLRLAEGAAAEHLAREAQEQMAGASCWPSPESGERA